MQKFHTDGRDRKYLEKIHVSLALFVSFKIHQGDDLLVFDPEANNVLLGVNIGTFNCPKYTTDRLVKNNI